MKKTLLFQFLEGKMKFWHVASGKNFFD